MNPQCPGNVCRAVVLMYFLVSPPYYLESCTNIHFHMKLKTKLIFRVESISRSQNEIEPRIRPMNSSYFR